MIKKVLPIIVCLVLVFGISASATNATDSTNADAPAVTEEMPMQRGGRQGGGGRGGMGAAPQGENMPGGELPPAMPEGEAPPAMPEGEMPAGEMTPPQNGGTAEAENDQQTQPASSENAADTATDATNENPSHMQRGDFGGGILENTQNAEAAETEATTGILDFIKTYSTPVTAVILLAAAFVFVIFYKRKTY